MFYKSSSVTVSRDKDGNDYIVLPDWAKNALGPWVKAIPYTYVNIETNTVIGAGVQLFSKETWSISKEDVLYRTSTPVFDENGNKKPALVQWFMPNRICQLTVQDGLLFLPPMLTEMVNLKSEVVIRQEVIDIFLKAE